MAVMEWVSRQVFADSSFSVSNTTYKDASSQKLIKKLNKYYDKQGSLVDNIDFSDSTFKRITCLLTITKPD